MYIREAHPAEDEVDPKNRSAGIRINDPVTLRQRKNLAITACIHLHLDFPAVIDAMDDRAATAYDASPDRIYVVKPDGTVGYRSAPGPEGFDPNELARYLRLVAGPAAVSQFERE